MPEPQTLKQEEIDKFVDALDKDQDGCVSYTELEQKLDQVYEILQPKPKQYNLHHSSRKDEQRHEFLRSMMGTEKSAVLAEEFKRTVASWQIPSLEQDERTEKEGNEYLKNISWGRCLRAFWEVRGPDYVFLVVVIGWQIGLGVWQCVKYSTGPEYQAALGWGVGLAKASAGALYPTLFFMLLSMSRWFSTFARRSHYVSRVINFDRSQSFHIRMALIAMVLATVHAIGHLSGSFNWGSRANRQPAVAVLLGQDTIPRSYLDYVRSLPGWTGLTAVGIYYVVGILSIPWVKHKSYELFQLGHLLMFPLLGLLMAHGTLHLLQFPVLGLILASPTLLVLCERTTRVLSGLHRIPTKMEVLDDETICITATIPDRRIWRYEAGQYVFLQVPQLSFFQWHPFTISTCIGREMQLHIKTDGDWTGKLRGLKDLQYVGIDGPFGAPAQRFYDFDQTIIVGAGIGVTPFSGILNDLQVREDHRWASTRRYSTSSHESEETGTERPRTLSVFERKKNARNESSSSNSNNDDVTTEKITPTEFGDSKTEPATANSEKGNSYTKIASNKEIGLDMYRRVDFHWIVRDKNYLLWFSDLLNKISSTATEHSPHLDIKMYTHVTKRREDISLHIYRWLLDKHRTDAQPMSPLTGLISRTNFGRPDFPHIINQHYDEMLDLFSRDKKRKRKVGVFFCGAPVIGAQLADLCHQMTLRGREDQSEIEYHFQIEVFG